MNKILQYRFPILFLITLLTIFFTIGLPKITKENGIESLLPENAKDYKYFKEMEDIFGATDQIILGLSFKESIYSPENIKFIQNISDFLKNIEGIEEDDVISATEIDNIDGIDNELIVEPIIPVDEEITLETVQIAMKKINDNDMLKGKIVSFDTKSTVVIATVNTSLSMNAELLAVVIETINSKIESSKLERDDVIIYVSGMAAVKHQTSEYMSRDMKVMFPLAILVIFAILFIILKSLTGIIMPLIVTLFSVVWTMGLKGWLGSPLTLTETIIPIMLIAIGCADGVHIVTEYLALKKDGLKPVDAIKKTMKTLAQPIILTSITTSIGFFSLILAPGVSIRNMGVFLGFGVLTAMLFSLILIPILLSFQKKTLEKKEAKAKLILFKTTGNFVIKYKFPIVIFACALLVLSGFGVKHIKVETDQIMFLKNGDPLKIATEFIQDNMGGVNTLDVIFEGEENIIKSPETLKMMEDLQHYVEQYEIVGYTLSLVDYIKKINYEFNSKNSDFNRLPRNTELVDGKEVNGRDIIANLLLIYEMGGGESLEKVVTTDYSMAKVSIRMTDTKQAGIENLIANINKWSSVNSNKNLSMNFSNDYIRIAMGSLIIESQIKSFISTLIAILILLMIIFRSPLSGLLTALPVIIAVMLNFTAMWLTGTSLNIGTSIIASVGMGVGIDYAIHFFSRYKSKYLEHNDNHRAIVETIDETAKPILSNAIAVSIGFMTLLISNYYIIAGIGWITALSMISTAICALFVLPALLAIFEPLKKKKEISMKKTIFAICILCSASLFAETDTNADEIMKSHYMLKEAQTTSSLTTMILIDKRGKKKVRKMTMFSMVTEVGDNSFMEFVEPADIKGTKFLTIGNDNEDNDQRLYLPALNKVRKISSSGKTGRFMGSDITYYDMEPKQLKDSSYSLIEEKVVDNKDCWVIESIPLNDDSPYSKVIQYISKNDYFSYRKDMYEKDKFTKSFVVVEVEEHDGILIPVKTVIDNYSKKHKTLLIVENIHVNPVLNESIFSVKGLN